MATAPTNTFQSYQSVGTREDLKDFISNIAPTATPFLTMCTSTDAENTYFEWQTDTFAQPNPQNAAVEGADSVGDAVVPTVRVGNRTQISTKNLVVSGTQDATNKAGRGKKETAYQITKKTKELKRDMEAALVQNNPSSAGSAATARLTGSAESWFVTNVNRGTGGANGGFSGGTVAAPTDGVLRPFTEGQLKSILQSVFNAGGDPDMLLMPAAIKQEFSTFSGNANRMAEAEEKKLFAAVDVYESDFGQLKAVPDRFMRPRSVMALQSDLWKVAYLRPLVVKPLGDTGDSTKKEIISEYGLMCMNEAGNGIIADVT